MATEVGFAIRHGVFFIDGRPREDATVFTRDYDSNYRVRRARVAFKNGYRLSIVWGTGTYGENWLVYDDANFVEVSATAEVAIMHNGYFANPFGWEDKVLGFQSSAQVLELINRVGELNS